MNSFAVTRMVQPGAAPVAGSRRIARSFSIFVFGLHLAIASASSRFSDSFIRWIRRTSSFLIVTLRSRVSGSGSLARSAILTFSGLL
ncbi:hypothetical protein BM43_7618 (plasmid) [Burkholderia gladioli]|nr:hypothetical protein BM43_7618 [Burkholderia gladioli]